MVKKGKSPLQTWILQKSVKRLNVANSVFDTSLIDLIQKYKELEFKFGIFQMKFKQYTRAM